MKLLLSIISELYRLVITIVDKETLLRKVKGQAQLDVACIINFETTKQKAFSRNTYKSHNKNLKKEHL